MKHPKPWKAYAVQGTGTPPDWAVDDANGNMVVYLSVGIDDVSPEPLAIEIVAAVNLREKLVEAAKELIRVVDSDNVEPVEMARCRFDDLREALSEGGAQ